MAHGRASSGILVVLMAVAGQDALAQEKAPASPVPGGAAARLETVLSGHKDAWRPCQETAFRVMDNAVARSTAAAQGREADHAKLDAEGEQLKKEYARHDCSNVKGRIVTDMKGTGASDAERQTAWNAFVKSLKSEEKPAAPAKE